MSQPRCATLRNWADRQYTTVKTYVRYTIESHPVQVLGSLLIGGAGTASSVHYCFKNFSPYLSTDDWITTAGTLATFFGFALGTTLLYTGMDLSLTSTKPLVKKFKLLENTVRDNCDTQLTLAEELKQENTALKKSLGLQEKTVAILVNHIALSDEEKNQLAQLHQEIRNLELKQEEKKGYVVVNVGDAKKNDTANTSSVSSLSIFTPAATDNYARLQDTEAPKKSSWCCCRRR